MRVFLILHTITNYRDYLIILRDVFKRTIDVNCYLKTFRKM